MAHHEWTFKTVSIKRAAACVKIGGLFVFLFAMFIIPDPVTGQGNLTELDQFALKTAVECRDKVTSQLEGMIKTNKATVAQIFDTFYIPIPNTNPQKYSTQYDKLTDENIRIVLDQFLAKNNRFVFVIAVDVNGYVPTHNSKYSRPLTGNPDADALNNRTKRLFNDRTGLAAARNTQPYLLQQYSRDTGEKMADLSVPIYIQGKHWGAIRVGYKTN